MCDRDRWPGNSLSQLHTKPTARQEQRPTGASQSRPASKASGSASRLLGYLASLRKKSNSSWTGSGVRADANMRRPAGRAQDGRRALRAAQMSCLIGFLWPLCVTLLATNLICYAAVMQVAARKIEASSESSCGQDEAAERAEEVGRFARCRRHDVSADADGRRYVKIGILLEEWNYEQANMFIRTIKMINEEKDETIRRLLNMFAARRAVGGPAGSAGATDALDLADTPASEQRFGRSRAPARSQSNSSHWRHKLIAADAADRSARSSHSPAPLEAMPMPSASGGAGAHEQERLTETEAGHERRRRRRASEFATPLRAANVKLEPVIEFLSDRQSALEADEKVCQLIASGVRAIMGPIDGNSIQHVQSICDTLEIPYFELRAFIGGGGGGGAASGLMPALPYLTLPPGRVKPAEGADQRAARSKEAPTGSATAALPANKLEALTLNLYPPSQLLNAAYIDLIYALNWTSFAIVYESSDSMIRLQDIFEGSSSAGSWNNKWRIRLFRHDPSGQLLDEQNNVIHQQQQQHQAKQPPVSPSIKRNSSHLNIANTFKDQPQLVQDSVQNDQPQAGGSNGGAQAKSAKQSGTFRDVFWRVKLSGEHNILLDVKTESLFEALKSAQQVGCMTEEFSYLVTSLDLHAIDLEDFKYSRTKITSFSLLQVAKLQQSALRLVHEFEGDFSSLKAHEQPAYFDEKYLESLGVHSMQLPGGSADSRDKFAPIKAGKSTQSHGEQTPAANRTHSSYTSWMNEAENNDQTRRELLQSSPASLGLLPTVDRNNEQRLFDFFLEQQERNMSRVRLSTSAAILHDSLLLFMLGLSELDPAGQFLSSEPGSSSSSEQSAIFCSLESAPWPHGSSLVNFMKQTTFSGLTGSVSFDQRGLRNDFKLDILGMAPNIRLVKIGEWHSRWAHEEPIKFAPPPPPAGEFRSARNKLDEAPATKRLAASEPAAAVGSQPSIQELTSDDFKSYDELSRRYESELKFYVGQLAQGKQVQVPYTKRVAPSAALQVNEIIFERLYREQADKIDTLIVTAKLSQPYFMLKETPNKLNGNDQYEGYAVDLIHELAKLVNFKYKWREVGDKKYGSKEVLANGTVVWNGMIGEIVRGQADLAIVDLTITAQREEAVDFTLPFMNTGISILFKKPTTKVTTLFSFLSPFSSDVWAYVLAAYCGISAILFLVGHLSPYEWADPHPCRHLNPDSDLTVLKNQFTLLNSFWFTIGSLMQQGSDLTPRSMSTRTIAGIWYFFTLIMISSYTANLAAFLTVEKVVYPIENVRDLGNQQEIKYGCVESGSTCLFFQDSQIDTYKKIDETMRRHRTYVRSNDEGQKRVGEGKFAFFMESTTIEYIIERNCNLTQIGGLIDSKGYGLATSKKSRHKRPYRTLLNEGILHLQETGMLHVLKNRWWKEKRGGGTCTDDGKGGGVTELSLANVGGVFVVLLGGLGISFLVAIAEFIWRARRSGSTRDRMCEEMMNDLKFALACKSSTKPISKSGNGNNFKRLASGRRLNTRSSEEEEGELFASCRLSNGLPNAGSQNISSAVNGNAEQAEPSSNKRGRKGLGGGATQPPPPPPPFSPKECDPILLHAMLTMLAQQQPLGAGELPIHSFDQTTSSAAAAAAFDQNRRTTSQPFLANSNNSHFQYREADGGKLTMSHSATVDENLARRLNGAGGGELARAFGMSFSDGELEDDHDEDFDPDARLHQMEQTSEGAPIDQQQQQQRQRFQFQSARVSAAAKTARQEQQQHQQQQLNGVYSYQHSSQHADGHKRRLLHAQKTIDID